MVIRFSTVFHLIFANLIFKNFCSRYCFFAQKIGKMSLFCTKVFILLGLKFGRNRHFFTKKSKKTWIFSIKNPIKGIEKNNMKNFVFTLFLPRENNIFKLQLLPPVPSNLENRLLRKPWISITNKTQLSAKFTTSVKFDRSI